MPRLSPIDASALVYLAEHPTASDRVAVVDRLSGDAKPVAEALLILSAGSYITRQRTDSKAMAAAQALIEWVGRKHEK